MLVHRAGGNSTVIASGMNEWLYTLVQHDVLQFHRVPCAIQCHVYEAPRIYIARSPSQAGARPSTRNLRSHCAASKPDFCVKCAMWTLRQDSKKASPDAHERERGRAVRRERESCSKRISIGHAFSKLPTHANGRRFRFSKKPMEFARCTASTR